MSPAMNIDPQQVKAIFLEAVENHTPESWDSFLNNACNDNAELRQQVEVLLDAHKRAGSYLEQRAVAIGPTIDQPIPRTGWYEDRPVQAAPGDRPGRNGLGLHGRATRTRPAKGGSQAHQAGYGLPAWCLRGSRPSGKPWR